MADGSKHIIAYILFIAFSLFVVGFSENTLTESNVVFAVSVASLFISISDLFDTKMGIDKRERLRLLQYYDQLERLETYYFQILVNKYGDEAKAKLESMSEEELNKLQKAAEEDGTQDKKDTEDFNRAIEYAKKRENANKRLSTIFYIA